MGVSADGDLLGNCLRRTVDHFDDEEIMDSSFDFGIASIAFATPFILMVGVYVFSRAFSGVLDAIKW